MAFRPLAVIVLLSTLLVHILVSDSVATPLAIVDSKDSQSVHQDSNPVQERSDQATQDDQSKFADLEKEMQNLMKAIELNSQKIIKLSKALNLMVNAIQAKSNNRAAEATEPKLAKDIAADRSVADQITASEKRLDAIYASMDTLLERMHSVSSRSADAVEATGVAAIAETQLDKLFTEARQEIAKMRNLCKGAGAGCK